MAVALQFVLAGILRASLALSPTSVVQGRRQKKGPDGCRCMCRLGAEKRGMMMMVMMMRMEADQKLAESGVNKVETRTNLGSWVWYFVPSALCYQQSLHFRLVPSRAREKRVRKREQRAESQGHTHALTHAHTLTPTHSHSHT